MKRFKTTVTRTDEYIIEIDETIIDEQWMDDFRHVFYSLYSHYEHAEHLAQIRARLGEGFIEGYGNVKIDGKIPWHVTQKEVENRLPCEDAFNIIIKSEDRECEVEVEEIN